VQNQEMVEAKVIGGQFFSFLYSFDYLSTEVNQRKTKKATFLSPCALLLPLQTKDATIMR
jgi:hypothetical protein